MDESLVIEKEKLLLVEGKDDRKVIVCLLKELDIQNIQVAYIKGKDKLKNPDAINILSAALKTSQYNKTTIKTLGIILDADGKDVSSSFQKICSFIKKLDELQIKNLSFDIPNKCAEFTKNKTKVGVFIMPDCKSAGMLETLCISSVKDEPIMKLVVDFINRVIEINKELSHLDKRKAQAYISVASPKAQKKAIGEAVEDGIFNINSPEFDTIKDFLKNMSEL